MPLIEIQSHNIDVTFRTIMETVKINTCIQVLEHVLLQTQTHFFSPDRIHNLYP